MIEFSTLPCQRVEYLDREKINKSYHHRCTFAKPKCVLENGNVKVSIEMKSKEVNHCVLS